MFSPAPITSSSTPDISERDVASLSTPFAVTFAEPPVDFSTARSLGSYLLPVLHLIESDLERGRESYEGGTYTYRCDLAQSSEGSAESLR